MPRKARALKPEAPRIRSALRLEWMRRTKLEREYQEQLTTVDAHIGRLAMDAYKAGMTYEAIAADLNISAGAAWRLIQRHQKNSEESV